MNEIERLRHLAGILGAPSKLNEEGDTGDQVTKTVAGHVDDEKDMIMKQLYQMGSYCVELYRMMGSMPDNSDFPHWWQKKVVLAAENLSAAKHYLENELQAPEVEAPLDPEDPNM